MAEPDVASRVIRYLHRQIVWLETGLRALDQLEQSLSDSMLDQFLLQQQLRDQELGHLAREQQVLLRDWESTENIPETLRTEVSALTLRAQGLMTTLLARHELIQTMVSEKLIHRENTIDTLKRGRDMLNKYRPGGTENSSWLLDKRA